VPFHFFLKKTFLLLSEEKRLQNETKRNFAIWICLDATGMVFIRSSTKSKVDGKVFDRQEASEEREKLMCR
jgi:hypothetical protein